MKYISVVVLLALMGWTWSLATTERSFKLEQHKAVEAGVEQDVRAFILRKFPTVREIYCSQLFTETVVPGEELTVRFRCQAAGQVGNDVAQQVYEGFIHLKSTDQFKTWNETGGEIRSPAITFQNGIRISPKDGDDGEGVEVQATAPATSEATRPAKSNAEAPAAVAPAETTKQAAPKSTPAAKPAPMAAPKVKPSPAPTSAPAATPATAPAPASTPAPAPAATSAPAAAPDATPAAEGAK